MEVVSAALIQVSFVKGEGMLEGNLFLFLFFWSCNYLKDGGDS